MVVQGQILKETTMKTRLIIGAGTATQVFRQTLVAESDWRTIILGSDGLWAEMPQDHKLGQPSHLLQLPGQPVPEYRQSGGTSVIGSSALVVTSPPNFAVVSDYQKGLSSL